MHIPLSGGNVWRDGERKHHPFGRGRSAYYSNTTSPLKTAFGKLKLHRMFPGCGGCLIPGFVVIRSTAIS